MKRKQSDSQTTFRLVETDWGMFGIVMGAQHRVVATFLPQPEKQIRRMIATHFPRALEQTCGADVFSDQLRDYFRGKDVRWAVEIDWGDVTAFRRRVLEACRRIPFGSTATYADLARAAGSAGAARAVGSTMATNPLPLIVPCHRVLRSDGSLGGFSSPQGPSQKERMLRLENPEFGRVTFEKSVSRSRVILPRRTAKRRSGLTLSA